MERSLALGVDIGGSHITAALVDLEKKAIVDSSLQRNYVNCKAASNIIFDEWCEVITQAYIGFEHVAKIIGIAMPGPFDYENGISLIEDQDKFRSLYNFNVKKEIATRLNIPSSNINFINDAAAFLQGEIFNGATSITNQNVLGLTLGTGLGSAIYSNTFAKDAALWDSVFLNGIAEDFLSTRWFIQRYHQLSGKIIQGVKELLEIVHKDDYALSTFQEFGYNLAHFLIPVIKKNNINVVIIGGNISGAHKLFFPELMSTLKRNNNDSIINITKLKEHAALIGAASCCKLSISL